MTRRIFSMLVASSLVLAAASLGAQGRGGGFGGGGGGGTFTIPTRLVLLTQTLKLDPAQVKSAKATLDAAFKNAAEARAQLAAAHEAIGAAIQAKKDPDQIASLVKAYSERAAAMTSLEMKALADVLKPLPEDIRAASARIDGAIAIMRAAFIGKKWDEAAGTRNY